MSDLTYHVVTRVSDRVSSLLREAEPPSSAEKELRKLREELREIVRKLRSAEKMNIRDKARRLRLGELKVVAYDAEDLIDGYEYEALRVTVEARGRHMDGEHDEVFDYPNSSHPLKLPLSDELATEIKNIRKRFREITDDWPMIRSVTDKSGCSVTDKNWSKPLVTTSGFDSCVFGRQSEKEETISWLLGGVDEPINRRNTVSVLRIVGVGGIGKTTFAQMIYDDTRVTNHFDYRGWVHLSWDLDLTRAVKGITSSFFMTEDKSRCLDDYGRLLKENLEGKSFILVLDDAWNEDIEFWDSFKNFINGIEAGGKVIVTTRNENVAKSIQTTPPLNLKFLSLDDSWLLFKKIAFVGRNRESNSMLQDIGQAIVKKCGGLPLAVKVLASALISEDEEEWVDILREDLLEYGQGHEVLLALKLSFHRMPRELRPCFLYLSLFPKDSILEKSTIIQQWMSQGFLSLEGEETSMHIGNAYFNELLQRSLLRYYDNDAFIMHDLIHDLAQSVGKDDFLLVTNKSSCCGIPETVRHVSVHVGRDYEKINLKWIYENINMKCLRTLILHGAHGYPVNDSLSTLTCLRTLILEDEVDLSYVIGNLKNLRYLHIHDVPESVYKLYHLQTLKAGNEIKLTRRIEDLINLEHLCGYESESLPRVIGGLTRLQTLEEFSVGAESWQCKLRQLKGFTNLSGSLTVRRLETVRWSDVTPLYDCLVEMSGIESLRLYWSEHQEDKKLAQKVLDCLKPHPKLKQLVIEKYSGDSFPMWLGDGSLSKLEELELRLCKCTSMPTLGQLPYLKRLKRVAVEGVKCVGYELLGFTGESTVDAVAHAVEDVQRRSCCFPSLEFLRFERMREWKEWNGVENSDFPLLRQLELRECRKLKALPSLSSLITLRLEREFHPSVLSSHLPKLQTLHIEDYQDASLKFPKTKSCLISLVKLVIENCSKLKMVSGLGNLVALQHLVIDRCPILFILPSERMPPNLLSVTVRVSPNCDQWRRNQALHQTRRLSWNSINDSGLEEIGNEIMLPLRRNDSVTKELDEDDNCEQKRRKQ